MGLNEKEAVRDFWNKTSCGEELYLTDVSSQAYAQQAASRYELEPYIPEFAGFEAAKNLKGLEIGVGLGADFENFVRAGADMSGIDLTPRAVEHVTARLHAANLQANIMVGDAENIAFPDNTFDFVYSYGVIHHSPEMPKAVSEILRVLRPGGIARVMIYNAHSLVGFMLWLRYGWMRFGRPLTLTEVYAKYLESPGTKAYTPSQAAKIFSGFKDVTIKTVLTHGDLLSSESGQRHRGLVLSLARALWPRWLLRSLFPSAGLFMLITATKG